MQSQGSEESRGLNSGAVVGIVLGLVILLLLAAITAAVIVFLTRRKRGQQSLNGEKTVGLNNPTYGKLQC